MISVFMLLSVLLIGNVNSPKVRHVEVKAAKHVAGFVSKPIRKVLGK